jgi:hypothetical protein
MMRIDIRIDRVVLDAATTMRGGDREIRRALEKELARLIAATPRSQWRRSRTIRAVRGLSLSPAHHDIGSATAHALHRAVTEGEHR